MLRDHPRGDYRFMPGIRAFSCGTVATPGHEIVHVTLAAPVPWRDGFARIDRLLREQGRPRTALCGIELRSPAPFSFDGFDRFNEGYRALLGEWEILVGEDNPIPRTNVCPLLGAPAEPSLFAFAYTVPGATPAPTFIVAGAGELRDRARGPEGIVRHGETSPDAMRGSHVARCSSVPPCVSARVRISERVIRLPATSDAADSSSVRTTIVR